MKYLYTDLVRPHLEYLVTSTYKRHNFAGKKQGRATKLPHPQNKLYKDRLNVLGLTI